MTLTTILNNGYLGMTAQGRALGTISDNVANASTTGFRSSDTQFENLVLSDRNAVANGTTGVTAWDRLNNTAGTISQTGVTTNAAILGNGFFVVQDLDFASGATTGTGTTTTTDASLELTRAGDFQPDKDGHLVNAAGKALMGIKLDPTSTSTAGSTDTADLTPVSLTSLYGYHEATTGVSLAFNLPTTQTVADTPTTANTVARSVTLVDSDGNKGSVTLRMMKTAEMVDGSSTWTVLNAGTTGADGKAVGDIKASDPTTWAPLGTLNFGPDGTLTGGATGSNLIMGVNPGGKFAPTMLDFGSYGDTGFAATSIPDIDTGYTQNSNGIAKGEYQDIQFTETGLIRATFSGGQQRDLYRIPDAIVANPTDLQSLSGTSFRTTAASGGITLGSFGNAKLGNDGSSAATVGATLSSGAVEGSNVQLENQFTTLIQAQRTYSAASKIVSTADEMTQTLIGLKT